MTETGVGIDHAGSKRATRIARAHRPASFCNERLNLARTSTADVFVDFLEMDAREGTLRATKSPIQGHIGIVDRFKHARHSSHAQPTNVNKCPHEPKPHNMAFVVAGLVGARALPGSQESFAQVELDRRYGNAASRTQLRHPHNR